MTGCQSGIFCPYLKWMYYILEVSTHREKEKYQYCGEGALHNAALLGGLYNK